MTFRHAIYFVVCCSCGGEAPAEKRDSRIEPPAGWRGLQPACCGDEEYVCQDFRCFSQTVHRLKMEHGTHRFHGQAFGAPSGAVSRFVVVRGKPGVEIVERAP